jgi:hypothetical protein
MNIITYKESFENKEKNKEKNKGHNINEKEETIFDLYMLLIGYVIIICFGLWFHKYFYNIIPNKIFKLSIFSVIIFPLVLYSYYIFHQIYSVREHKSYELLLEEVTIELSKEDKISSIIPAILFGIGLIYAYIEQDKKSKLLKNVAPYLIFSLIFGTIITNMFAYLVLDYRDLHRVTIVSDIDFIAISLSFGLMIISLLMPFITIY